METLKKIERLIFEAAAWKLILAISAITVFKTGIWHIPNLGSSFPIALNPFVNPFSNPDAHYLLWSWLGPFLAWLVGVKSPVQFFAFYLAFAIAFTLLFIKVAFANLPDKAARLSIVLFAILPVSATAYFWVSLDAITLFLMLLALAFPQIRLVAFIAGTLLGMHHFEQGFFAAAGLLFAVFMSDRQDYKLKYSVSFCLAFLVGVIAGKLALVALFEHYSIRVNSGRMYWLQEHLGMLLSQFFFHFHYIVWSVLGLGWLVALRFVDWGRKSVPFFVTLAGLCLLLPISGDQTRVLAIITFPLVAAYWLFNEEFLEKITRTEASLGFAAWALMPWSWVWGGVPRWSALPYDIAFVLHGLFGWFYVPSNPALWPFDPSL